MDNTGNKITVYINGVDEPIVYDGNYFIYREDFIKEGCIHFKDVEGRHHRIYNAAVIIDEN